MAKTVYSIVLDDEVVRAVDALAGSQGLSRSAAINRILAQHVQMDTAEQRIQDVFAVLEQMAQGSALQLLSSSDAQMQLRSPLRYKYNPNVKYQIELYGGDPDALGMFRAGMRTQNSALLDCLDSFFQLWVQLEPRYLPRPEQLRYRLERGRLLRVLRHTGAGTTADTLGEALSEYVNLFDRCLKTYFELRDDPQAEAATAAVYCRGLTPVLMKL